MYTQYILCKSMYMHNIHYICRSSLIYAHFTYFTIGEESTYMLISTMSLAIVCYIILLLKVYSIIYGVLCHLLPALYIGIKCVSTVCLEYISKFSSDFSAVIWPYLSIINASNTTTWMLSGLNECSNLDIFYTVLS